jgi:RES domain-containing protein
VIVAWRLVKQRHQAAAFDGEGARRFGGRWNQPGTRVVYVSDSLALAALETFVHLGRAAMQIAHVAFKVEVPDDLPITTVTVNELPPGWRDEPPSDATKEFGSKWVARAETAVLRVPSVIVPRENNFVLNPDHGDFTRLRISDAELFHFGPRMWK